MLYFKHVIQIVCNKPTLWRLGDVIPDVYTRTFLLYRLRRTPTQLQYLWSTSFRSKCTPSKETTDNDSYAVHRQIMRLLAGSTTKQTLGATSSPAVIGNHFVSFNATQCEKGHRRFRFLPSSQALLTCWPPNTGDNVPSQNVWLAGCYPSREEPTAVAHSCSWKQREAAWPWTRDAVRGTTQNHIASSNGIQTPSLPKVLATLMGTRF